MGLAGRDLLATSALRGAGCCRPCSRGGRPRRLLPLAGLGKPGRPSMSRKVARELQELRGASAAAYAPARSASGDEEVEPAAEPASPQASARPARQQRPGGLFQQLLGGIGFGAMVEGWARAVGQLFSRPAAAQARRGAADAEAEAPQQQAAPAPPARVVEAEVVGQDREQRRLRAERGGAELLQALLGRGYSAADAASLFRAGLLSAMAARAAPTSAMPLFGAGLLHSGGLEGLLSESEAQELVGQLVHVPAHLPAAPGAQLPPNWTFGRAFASMTAVMLVYAVASWRAQQERSGAAACNDTLPPPLIVPPRLIPVAATGVLPRLEAATRAAPMEEAVTKEAISRLERIQAKLESVEARLSSIQTRLRTRP